MFGGQSSRIRRLVLSLGTGHGVELTHAQCLRLGIPIEHRPGRRRMTPPMTAPATMPGAAHHPDDTAREGAPAWRPRPRAQGGARGSVMHSCSLSISSAAPPWCPALAMPDAPDSSVVACAGGAHALRSRVASGFDLARGACFTSKP